MVLILRPQPGADESAARAAAIGLRPEIAPIFTIEPRAWEAPDPKDHDAIMLSSANAPRLAGPEMLRFTSLPCYAVGPATAAAARAAGFSDVRTGPSDARALLSMITSDGVRRLLHLCGRDHIAIERPGLSITRRTVYASEARDTMPPAGWRAIDEGALVLLHSPRAARHFADLVDRAGRDRGGIRIATISEAAAAAAGPGWAQCSVAPAMRDEPLLELAAKLCKTAPDSERSGNGH